MHPSSFVFDTHNIFHVFTTFNETRSEPDNRFTHWSVCTCIHLSSSFICLKKHPILDALQWNIIQTGGHIFSSPIWNTAPMWVKQPYWIWVNKSNTAIYAYNMNIAKYTKTACIFLGKDQSVPIIPIKVFYLHASVCSLSSVKTNLTNGLLCMSVSPLKLTIPTIFQTICSMLIFEIRNCIMQTFPNNNEDIKCFNEHCHQSSFYR